MSTVLVANVPKGWTVKGVVIAEPVEAGVIGTETVTPARAIRPEETIQLWDNLIKAGRIQIPETVDGVVTWRALRGFPYRLAPDLKKANGRRIVTLGEQ